VGKYKSFLGLLLGRDYRKQLDDNFDQVDTDIKANSSRITTVEQDSITRDNDHKNNTKAHKAENIEYTGSIVNVLNVKAALEALLSQLNNLVGNTGNSNSEIVDGRMGADNVARATLGILIREMHAKLIDADRVNQILTHGLQVINASQNSPVEFEIQGRTLVNLLAYDGNFERDSNGDGVANGWDSSLIDAAASIVSDFTNGTKAQRITHTNTTRSIKKKINVKAGNYYVAICDFKSDGIATSILALEGYGSQIISASAIYKTVYRKFNPTADADISFILYSGNGWVQFDGARLYEVTAEEYAKIGVEWNDEEVAKRFPYVDAVKHLQNLAVIAEGENLLPPFSEWTLHANAKMISPYELELNATSTGQTSNVSIPVFPGQQYTFSCTKTNGGQHYVEWLDSNKNTIGNTGATITQSYTVTVPVGVAYLKYMLRGNGAGTFSFSQPILTLGSTAKPFVPRNPSYLFAPVKLGQIGTVKDSLFKQDGQWQLVERVKKDVVLDGSLPWTFVSDNPGYKTVRLNSYFSSATENTGNIITKYNGEVLKKSVTLLSNEVYLYSSGTIALSIPDTDTGFGESYTPTADELKAIMYGWQVKTIDANGKPTAWRNLVDGTDAPTQTLAYVKANLAPNFTPYKLSYVLATPDKPQPIPYEGDISVSGATQVEVTSGVVVREKMPTPYINAGVQYFNYQAVSFAKNKVDRIISIHKNGIVDTKWTIYNNSVLAAVNGKSHAAIVSSDFDSTAEYTVTYLILDRHQFTNNATEVKAFYETSPKSVQDKLVEDVTDIETAVSILIQANADLYKRVKALGG
jgi:hypothetical protein